MDEKSWDAFGVLYQDGKSRRFSLLFTVAPLVRRIVARLVRAD